MRYYPVNLDLQGRSVVVVGAGSVGFRKLKGLLEAGAKLKVIDPDPPFPVKRLAARKKISWIKRAYRTGDLGKAFVAVAATDDREVNRKIQAEAEKKKILLNIVDKPEFCTFTLPARLNRGEFMVTVSTGGSAPGFAKKVRERLEKVFGPEYGKLVASMAKEREKKRKRRSA
jgi:precorrin-2 dehydrogenase/sirohydrochlorin ferrochelatase